MKPSLRRTATAALAAGVALAHAASAYAQASAAGTGNIGNTSSTSSNAAAGGHVPVSSATGLAQAGLGLFAVIALILLLAWLARRAGLVRHGQGGQMKVVGSTMLGPRQRLVMVEVGDTCLVLGVSAGEIRTLHTLPAQAAHKPDQPSGSTATPGSAGSFGQKLLRAMQDNLKS
ncbi:flagellar biosynthesis protein, FliO [Cupriavidus basilensis OR16]|uniref:Flagellar protein n=1 Tax=Cupriavidus basilensis OR16 TaxID=1127483 RepID=H1S0M5_9BURK|nr:flagellar biosynthetic protein FliO [Cupriavidus basilensis]EHP43884.1 flagellar biosynthesis protein, FliO [Cupriavidus basilensis OR16]